MRAKTPSRLTLLCACLFCSLALWAQAPATSTPKPADTPPKTAIEGRVLNAATDEPVRKATLTLMQTTGSTLTITAESDQNGHFSFQNLAPGRYQLLGERNGFARQVYGSRSNAYSGTTLVVTAGQEIKDLLFKLPPTAVIAGRVLDEEGEPVSGALVSAMKTGYNRGKRDWTPFAVAQTNDMGEFRLSGLKAGKYVVAATYRNILAMASTAAKPSGDKPEMSFTTTYFPSALEAANASWVEVGMGAEVGGIDVRMVKVPTFRVKGNAAEFQQGKTMLVTLTPRGSGMMALMTRPMTVVQPDGTFEFRGVPPGAYWLSAMGTDMTAASAIQPIEVGDQHVENVSLPVASSADLPVTLNVEGKTAVDLKTVRITLTQSDFESMPRSTSLQDGKLVVKNLTPARYEVRVASLPENVYVKGVRLGMTEVDEKLDFSAGVRGTLQLTLSDGGASVEGSVRGEDANPMPGATVALIPDSRRTALYKEVTCDPQGHFSFRGVTPGDYRVMAFEDVESGATQDPDFVKSFESDAQRVAVKENDRKIVSLRAISVEKVAGARAQ